MTKKDYDKVIVVDFDNTLAYTDNGIPFALPNQPLIDKLNELRDNGYLIEIFTARGTISCENDIGVRVNTFYDMIHDWLIKHEVKFDKLSFNKPLARYYIDDKAITPEDFLDERI